MFNIPNLLTVANLITGSLGILALKNGNLEQAFYYVIICVIFDFADGFAARKLGQFSPMGKELDSLADMVSFGVLPGMLMYFMIDGLTDHQYLPYVGLLITAFSGLRLAKFNVDERQSDTFYGLPTPANAVFFVSIPYIKIDWLQNPYVLVGLCLVFSWLLISEIKMFALKFKNFTWKDNKWKFMAMVFALLMIAYLGMPGLPLLIILYILFSVFKSFGSVQ